MFGKITQEFQCLEGYKKNSDILKDEIKILKFKRKRKEIQCLEEWEKCLEEQDEIPRIGRIKKEM